MTEKASSSEAKDIEFAKNMNNFYLKLDVGLSIEEMENGQTPSSYHIERQAAFKHGMLDVRHRKHFPEDKGFSDTFLNQTPREFYSTIDQVQADLGLTIDKLPDGKSPTERNLHAKDIYVELQEMGYFDIDLST